MKNSNKAIILGIILAVGAWYESILLFSNDNDIKLTTKHWISLCLAIIIALLIVLEAKLKLAAAM